MSLGSMNCTDISFMYFAELASGEDLPSFIVMDSSNRIFQVYSNNPADVKRYTIKITGYPNIGDPLSFTWILDIRANLPP